MELAIIKTGGKQYKVKAGDKIKVEKLPADVGAVVEFDTLLLADKNDIEIGRPALEKKVKGKIIGQGRAKKISVIKYKSKVRYRRNLGHRQLYSEVEIV